MARPGSALDNAVIESWHSTLEFELRAVEHFTTRHTARAKVAAWIEDYNTHRRHSACQMMPPVTYESSCRGDAATAWKWAGVSGPFKIGLGAERAGLDTRCNESPAILRAEPVAGKRLPDQTGPGRAPDAARPPEGAAERSAWKRSK